MAKVNQLPRGIRNNNPLNIRIGNVWLGETTNPTDLEFEQFVSMEYGIRAGFVLLRRYINHYHLTTIAQIISRWAPRHENDTVRYVDNVCRRLCVHPDTQLVFTDKDTMTKLVAAMILQECGIAVSDSVISRGYDLA